MDELREISGVGAVTAKKLHDAGYDNYDLLVSATADELAENAGVSASLAERIIESAKEMLEAPQTQAPGMQSPTDLLQSLQSMGRPGADGPVLEPEPEELDAPDEDEIDEGEIWPELEAIASGDYPTEDEVPETAEDDVEEEVSPEPEEEPEVEVSITEVPVLEEEVPVEADKAEVVEEEDLFLPEEPEEAAEVPEDVPVAEELPVVSSETAELVAEDTLPEQTEEAEVEAPAEQAPTQATRRNLHHQIIDELAESVIQDSEIMEKLAKEIGSELAGSMIKVPAIRQKVIQQALSQPNFIKMLVSRVVKGLS